MATIETASPRQTCEALSMLTGRDVVLTTTGGMVAGKLAASRWEDKGIEFLPAAEPGSRRIPFGEIVAVDLR
jgi:hypothetical protein